MSGGTVMGGAAARYINIPVPKRAAGGVFDIAVEGVVGTEILPTAFAAAEDLRKARGANWGLSFPVHRDYLEKHHASLPKRVRRIEDRFVDTVQRIKPGEATAADLRIARKFGLVLAGLTLAVKAGAVTFTQKEVKAAVRQCFSAAVSHLDQAAQVLATRIKTLRGIVRDREKFPRLDKGQIPPVGALGFRRKKGGVEHAYMRADQVGRALRIIADHEVADLVQSLVDKGKIIPDAGGDKTRPVKIAGKPIRHYVFAPAFLKKTAKRRKKVARRERRSMAQRRAEAARARAFSRRR
jgi:hypothetical protein